MEGWTKYKLGDLIQINPENIGRKTHFKEINYFDISSVKSGYVEDVNTIKIDNAPSRAKRIVRKKDTILSTVRPGNRSFYYFYSANNNDVVSTGFAVLRPDLDFINERYLYYLVSDISFTNYLVSNEKGATYPAVTPEDIARAKINLPPLPTQKKIAKILSAYDELIENNLKRIKLLEEMAQKTYEEWFVRFKFPGHEDAVFDEESGLPGGWSRTQIGHLVDFQNGYAFKSSFYTKGAKYKIVTIRNVQDGVFIPDVTDTISKKPANLKDYHLLATGDIIMSLTGNIGRICLVYGNDYLLNQRVAKLKPRKEIYQSFVYCLFRNRHTLKVLENISNGAAQQNLSPVNASKQPFIVATDECLTRFNRRVKPFVETISMLNIQNKNLKEARDILLPRLMAGMIDTEQLELKL